MEAPKTVTIEYCIVKTSNVETIFGIDDILLKSSRHVLSLLLKFFSGELYFSFSGNES